MKFYVIASSSKGNVSYLESGNKKILIDVGVSYLKIKQSLKKINVDVKDITDVFITHEHTDHVRGLNTLLKNTNPEIYMSSGTKEALDLKTDVNIIEAYQEIKFEKLAITPLPLSHDANEPLGFLFENELSKIAFITDTGFIEEKVKEKIKNASLYYLESNHDPYLLTNSKRPYYLIRRILNETGHLSNYDAAYYLSKMLGENTTHVIFAHVSEECNTSNHIIETFKDVLTAQEKDFSNIKFIEAKPNEPLEPIKL